MGRFHRLSLQSSLVILGFVYSVSASANGVEIAGGIHTAFDGDHRELFGNATAFSVAYSAPLKPGDVHLIVEVGYVSNSGSITWPIDPTFENPETHYWCVPVIIGLRTNLLPERDRGDFGLYFGGGIMTLFTGFEGPEGFQDSASTLGAIIELQPQVKLMPNLEIWGRGRLSVSPDASYNEWSLDVNYSGATLQLGVSLGQP